MSVSKNISNAVVSCAIIACNALQLPMGERAREQIGPGAKRLGTEPGIDRVQAVADVSHSGCVVIATKPVHGLQIRPIVHNWEASPTIPPKLHPGPCSNVGVVRGTDTQTDARDHYTFRVVYDSREM